MAKAISRKAVVGVTLNLSKEEAQTLVDLIGWKVGGKPGSRREYTDSIHRAMEENGFYSETNYDIKGGVQFE